MDTDSNVLSTVLCNDFGDGIYYSFAVKGSFIINVKQISGTVQAMLNAFFFDPMLDAEADAANQKKDVSATLKGAREVTLSWTNPQPSKTAIYRKIKGQPDSAYEQIAYLKDKKRDRAIRIRLQKLQKNIPICSAQGFPARAMPR